jgi:hypothetical protein
MNQDPRDSARDSGAEGTPGTPNTPDSEDYHGDSERYQEAEEYPWPFEEGTPSGGADYGDNADDWMPDVELGEVDPGVDGLEPNRRDWQVNVRLDHARYAELKAAADVYGTTPTALARMLLNRGSKAILNAHRAEMAAARWPDRQG